MPPAFAATNRALSEATCFACACPLCSGQLRVRESTASCLRCDSCFPFESGVIDLRLTRDNHYDNPLKQSDMLKINERFSRLAWNETLGQFLQLSGEPQVWLDNIMDEGRFASKVYLRLISGGRLLDYGCKMGASTKNLAPHFAQTYAIEQTFENAVFTRQRLDQSNADDDITVVACENYQQIPLQDSSIDVVVANHVLESAGECTLPKSDPSNAQSKWRQALSSRFAKRASRLDQLSLLQEMNRVLEPDGQLFLLCTNQFDYKQFTDSNSDWRQITKSILRLLFAKLGLLTEHNPNLHTLWEYQRLLKRAGFTQIDFVAIFENDDASEEMRPGPGKFQFWLPPRQESWKKRIKRNPYLAQRFGIIARKTKGVCERLEDKIGYQVSKALGSELADFRTTNYLVSRKGKLIFRATCAGQDLFIRVPLTRHAAEAELHNHSTLLWLQANKSTLSNLFPRPISDGCIAKQVYFSESAVTGRPLVDVLKQQGEPERCLRAGLDFLSKLNERNDSPPPRLSGSAYQRLVTEPLQNINSLVNDDEHRELTAFFSSRLENKRITRGLVHGDYSARNILLENGRVSGLLDWEESDYDGLPALDAICLVFSCYSRLGEGFKGGLSLVEMARRNTCFSRYLPELDDYYRRTQVDENCHEGLVLLYWVQVISHRVRLGRTVGNVSSDLMVDKIVRSILDFSAKQTHKCS